MFTGFISLSIVLCRPKSDFDETMCECCDGNGLHFRADFEYLHKFCWLGAHETQQSCLSRETARH